MELITVSIIAFVVMGFTVYWGGKFLAWVGDIPPFTIKSLIRNKGWAYWDDPNVTSSKRKQI